MGREEIISALRSNEGKWVRITFDSGEIQRVILDGVDEDGVLHSGQDGINPRHFWTRFESIVRVEPLQRQN